MQIVKVHNVKRKKYTPPSLFPRAHSALDNNYFIMANYHFLRKKRKVPLSFGAFQCQKPNYLAKVIVKLKAG